MIITSSWIWDILILCFSALFLSYKYFTRNFDYWKKKGIYFPKPTPFFGNYCDIVTFKTTIQELLQKFYDETDDPYFGMFLFDEPVLVLKSPKLIKDVLLKEFSVFPDRRVATPKHSNMSYSIFFLKYLPWKRTRSKISPLFTSGMLKNMHAHIEHINELTTNYLNENVGVINVMNIGDHFATEMIARCFYGANPQCFDQETTLFTKYVHSLFNSNIRNAIKNLFYVKPSWVSLLRLNYVDDDAMNFFEGAFKDAMISRAKFDGKPQNFIDVANKAVKEKQGGKSDVLEFKMALSNAILFLIAGLETTSTILAFTLYELAMQPKVQEKLRDEVIANKEKFGGFTYEGNQDNKYLEMCINETMRKYPALPFLDRIPSSDYRFEGTDLVVEKGTSVIIPFYAIQRDEKYFPHPEKYDPERFLDDSINSEGLNFIPFGDGPRICIGQNLGMDSLYITISCNISHHRLMFLVRSSFGTDVKFFLINILCNESCRVARGWLSSTLVSHQRKDVMMTDIATRTSLNGKRLGILGLSMALSNIVLNFKVDKCDRTPERIEFDPKSFALAAKGGLHLNITQW